MQTVHHIKGEEMSPDGDLNIDAQVDDQERAKENLGKLIRRLRDEAKRRVDRRIEVERRWLEDLRQYHGEYADTYSTEFDRRTGGSPDRRNGEWGSTVFQNVTRPKTNAMMARLWDLLFPTDDRNWSVGPTPVPEMQEQMEEMSELLTDARDTRDDAQGRMDEAVERGDEEAAAAVGAELEQASAVLSEVEQKLDDLHEVMKEATGRARLMEREIQDQLVHSRWPAEARDAIEDACKIGIGIIKGPVLGEKMVAKYAKIAAQGGGAEIYELQHVPSDMPAAYRVDPWGFFPDPDQRRIEDSEGFFERHLLNKSQLRKMARRPDIDQDAIRRLLRGDPERGSIPSYLTELSNITGLTSTDSSKEFYQVWEHTGPLEPEDIELLADHFEDEGILDVMEETDPLTEIHAKVWFCQDEVLSFSLHPLDSQEPIYSAFTLEREEAGPWGYGIPYIMRASQAIINAAQRMMMDNAALGSAPQIVVNKGAVRPANGDWALTPRKVWEMNPTDNLSGLPPFQEYSFNMHQQELANIIALERQMIDEITAMPALAQGEQGAGVTKTAQGMALLMNSANVVFRRVVKNFDDDVTVPMIRRFYHWNMQFSDKDEIKGDYEVEARGASVLLVREMQAQNLIMIADRFADHPVYGKLINHDALLAEIFRAHMVKTENITFTKQEQEENARRASQEMPPEVQAAMQANEIRKEEVQIKRDEVDLRAQISNREWDARLEMALMEHEREMHKLAEMLNMTQEQVDASIEKARLMAEDKTRAARINADSRERSLAAEIAMAERTGKSSGGAV